MPTNFAGRMRRSFKRDANIGRAVYHVIVGDDVSVRRDDDAAADAVLDARLSLLPHRSPEHRSEELLHGIVVVALLLAFLHRLLGDTLAVTATLTIDGVTREATVSIA